MQHTEVEVETTMACLMATRSVDLLPAALHSELVSQPPVGIKRLIEMLVVILPEVCLGFCPRNFGTDPERRQRLMTGWDHEEE